MTHYTLLTTSITLDCHNKREYDFASIIETEIQSLARNILDDGIDMSDWLKERINGMFSSLYFLEMTKYSLFVTYNEFHKTVSICQSSMEGEDDLWFEIKASELVR